MIPGQLRRQEAPDFSKAIHSQKQLHLCLSKMIRDGTKFYFLEIYIK